jgi:hypothetical protein
VGGATNVAKAIKRISARDGMLALARTPVLPEAIPEGALSPPIATSILATNDGRLTSTADLAADLDLVRFPPFAPVR